MRFHSRGIERMYLFVRCPFVRRFLAVFAIAMGFSWSSFSAQGHAQPLTGSNFDAGNGVQTNFSPGARDWRNFALVEQLCSGGAQQPCLTFIEDLTSDDFTRGSKQNMPGSWQFGQFPPRARAPWDIQTLWHIVDDEFFYTAFHRSLPKSNSWLAIELNQAGPTSSGGIEVPCRSTGDVAIAYESKTLISELLVWESTVGEGCATEGQFTVLSRETEAMFVAEMNNGAIINFLPPQGTITTPSTISKGQFGEAALNIDAVQDAVETQFPVQGCPDYSHIWAHSATSSSGSASMKDFIPPEAVTLHACPTVPPTEPPTPEEPDEDEGEILGLGGQPVIPAAALVTAAPVTPAAPAPEQEGTAKLSKMPVCPTRVFTVTVRGEHIAQATFFLDGKKLKRVKASASKATQAKSATSKNRRRAVMRKKSRRRAAWTRSNRRRAVAHRSQNRIALRINARTLSTGTHSLRVRVRFTVGTTPETKTLRAKVTKCPPATAPLFTG